MYRSTEVEDWLYSIGLQELIKYFLEDGFNTLEAVRQMRQTDIDAIVDRNGYMVILNEEIDKLNYLDRLGPAATRDTVSQNRYGSMARGFSQAPDSDNESRDALMARYHAGGIPAVGFASTHLARRAKSKSNRRGASLMPNSRSSVERYLPGSAVQAYEDVFANRRALSAAAEVARQEERSVSSAILEERQLRREEERQKRAKTDYEIFEKRIQIEDMRFKKIYEKLKQDIISPSKTKIKIILPRR